MPTSAAALIIFVGFVLPGFAYQAVRTRLRGPTPEDRDPTTRVLRAVAFSAGMHALYAAIFGPLFLRWLRTDARLATDLPISEPRWTGMAVLTLLVGIPALVAWLDDKRLQHGRFTLKAAYSPTPQAWDHIWKDPTPCFVRLRMRDGTWAGGYWGEHSFASSYPEPQDLYLEVAYRMTEDGHFAEVAKNTDGIYIRAADVDIIEFIQDPEAEREEAESDAP